MLPAEDSLDLRSLGERLRSGNLRPREVVAGVLERIAARGDDKVWIHLAKREVLAAQAEVLERRGPEGLPLYGIPFAVKDNIDVAGQPTTAACPAFAYTPRESAPVVQRLLDAGAIAIGKTNLDQFATGLVGTRSPYGACANAFDAKYISGGSSSGSAVAVAAGLVSFALGTDTAGPGRVPAAFNNIVGLKPTRGLLSTRGVAPACRSLDCVSIFGLTAEDARAVLAVARGFDSDDPFSRRPRARGLPSIADCRIGVPRRDQLEFFGNRDAERLFGAATKELERMGAQRVEIDFAPFLEAARLLYGGPWVAERYLAIREFFEPARREGVSGHAGDPRWGGEIHGVGCVCGAVPVRGAASAGGVGVGGDRLPRHAHRRDDLHDRGSERRPDPAEQQSRLLHELHESARPRRDRGSGRVPEGRVGVRDHARGAGVFG
jgi:allophanate hydrolase